MFIGRQGSEHGGEGGPGQGGESVAVGKADAVLCQGIDGGGGVPGVAVAAEPVGPQGVYRYDDDILQTRFSRKNRGKNAEKSKNNDYG